jgi:hypothetical protein
MIELTSSEIDALVNALYCGDASTDEQESAAQLIERLRDGRGAYLHDLRREIPNWILKAEKTGAVVFLSSNEIYLPGSREYVKVGDWLFLDETGHIQTSAGKPSISANP